MFRKLVVGCLFWGAPILLRETGLEEQIHELASLDTGLSFLRVTWVILPESIFSENTVVCSETKTSEASVECKERAWCSLSQPQLVLNSFFF